MKKILLLPAILLSASLFSQQWVEKLMDPSVSFYEVREEFNNYWQGKTIEKGKGYKQFRRYEYFMAPRVYPSGDRTLASKAYQEFENYLASGSQSRSMQAGNWTPLGPNGVPSGGGGAGRVNFVRFHPTTSSTIWVGTPDGGLWKTTNSGGSWTTNTNNLTVIGCSDLAIDPANPATMYLATGDGDAGDSYSVGVLKTTDGGTTWNATGLAWNVNQGRRISRLLINPSNPSILIAFATSGIYRTTNGGTSWTTVSTQTGFKDAEFKPGDPNTVYAASDRFYKSTDGGVTWTNITSGLPANTAVDRFAIGVTPADPAYVYILAGDQATSGFDGLYRSVDSGTNFTTRSTTPNILGWQSNGGGTGGQSWYDLAIAVSQTNRDVVICGGVNIWRSTNGGTSWTINAHWTGSGAPYVHADIHALEFLPGSGTTYFAGCDGGVFRTTNSGGGWSDLSSNLQIAQMYRLGMSTSNANLVITGHQDNGTNLMNTSGWNYVIGGDGMECFIDRTNNNIMYGELYNGDFYRSTDGGNTFNNIVSGTPGNGAWVTPWCQDPNVANTLYSGFTNVYKSTNQGTSWSQIGTISGGSGDIIALDVAPSNSQVIYAAKYNAIFKTTNGGSTWTNITGTLPVSSSAITYIEINPSDANHVWVTFSGYTASNKVFVTTNGGSSWTNISTGLPNLPVNCIVYQNGTSDGIYVGTDVGVYYRDASTAWTSFFTGMPNVIVNELEIYYNTGKIRAATFGRGLWESDLITPGALAPVADFTSSTTTGCPGVTINFTDQSSFTPTTWSWSFPGGTPSTSTSQNPSVTYNTAGTYSVTLTVTNANGSDPETKSSYITITSPIALPLQEGFQTTTFLPANWTAKDVNGDNIFYTRTTTAGGFGTSTASALFDNYTLNAAGARDEMWTPKYDFTGLSTATLTFDVAYAQYDNTYSDSLAVLISTDCGLSFTQVFMKGGTTLATAPAITTGMFVPTSAQWRTETISLNSYTGQGSVMVVFQNRGRWGQAMYIDNINISGTAAVAPVAGFTASSTSVCSGQTVTFTDQSTGSPTSWSWTFPGGTPSSSTSQNPSVTYSTPGTYNVTLTATNANGSDSQTNSSYITVNSNPTANAGANASFCAGSSTTLSASGGGTYSWSPSTGLSSTTVSNPTASPSATTTYTVTVTNTNGCTDTDQVLVTVNANPNANAGTDAAICAGSSVTLTASGGGTYSWSPSTGLSSATVSNPAASPSSTTTYTVTVTNANGCTDTDQVVVTVNSSPSVPLITQAGNTLSTTSPGPNYQWYLNGSPVSGATSSSCTPTADGNYTVEIIDANGCSSTSAPYNFSTVGIDGKEDRDLFTIYPNPSQGEITITFNSPSIEDYVIEIKNSLGQKVSEKKLVDFSGTYSEKMNLASFGKGIYYITVRNEKMIAVGKITLQ